MMKMIHRIGSNACQITSLPYLLFILLLWGQKLCHRLQRWNAQIRAAYPLSLRVWNQRLSGIHPHHRWTNNGHLYRHGVGMSSQRPLPGFRLRQQMPCLPWYNKTKNKYSYRGQSHPLFLLGMSRLLDPLSSQPFRLGLLRRTLRTVPKTMRDVNEIIIVKTRTHRPGR